MAKTSSPSLLACGIYSVLIFLSEDNDGRRRPRRSGHIRVLRLLDSVRVKPTPGTYSQAANTQRETYPLRLLHHHRYVNIIQTQLPSLILIIIIISSRTTCMFSYRALPTKLRN